MPQSVLAEYVPDEYKLLPDDALSFQKRKWQPRVTATEAAKEFTKKTGQLIFWLEQILAQHNQNAVKTLRYMAGRPDIADCHLTWLYAVNYYRNDSAVHTAFRQFMDGRLPEILYDLVTQEKAIVTDRNFYQRFSDESTEPKQGSAAIVLRRYAIRFLAALDNRLISEFNFQWGEEIKLYLLYRLPETFPEGFVLSAVYRDMLRSQEDDIRVLQQVVTLGMDTVLPPGKDKQDEGILEKINEAGQTLDAVIQKTAGAAMCRESDVWDELVWRFMLRRGIVARTPGGRKWRELYQTWCGWYEVQKLKFQLADLEMLRKLRSQQILGIKGEELPLIQ